MIKNKKIKILAISILCILTLAIGLSYGYYLLNRVQENGNVAGSQCFNLEFTNEKNAINLDDMYPISDEEGKKLTPYSFTITNTCDMLAGYSVNMEMLEGTILNSKYLDVMINNEEIKLLTNYESTDTVITGSTESRILAKGTLAYNDSVDYTVRFWMDKDVEDVDSMNKYFASKIVVVATPSSWNPKDAGYDTLHDAILANEYQTTPEDAVKKIGAKGTPDFSQTAPLIIWKENYENELKEKIITKPSESMIGSDTTTSQIAENEYKMRLCKEKKLDLKSGIFNLENCSFEDPTLIDFEQADYYVINERMVFSDNSQKINILFESKSTYIYQVHDASKEIVTYTINNKSYNAISYTLKVSGISSIEIESDKSDKGLYKSIDDLGSTYYYRGNINNNNVYFAGFYWQIIRINGDDSIRMIYNGTNENSSGVLYKGTYFNANFNSPAYAGYMYGSNIESRESSVKNEVNSSIKENVDNWYKQSLINYSQFVADAGFCNDRSIYSGDGYSTNKDTNFSQIYRNLNNIVTFECQDSNDLFTLASSDFGNKALTYSIGLPTYDELVGAGLLINSKNPLSWINSSEPYWLMTPTYYMAFDLHQKCAYFYNATSVINDVWTNIISNIGIRPVINLKSDVKITGGIGTTNDPFVVDTN